MQKEIKLITDNNQIRAFQKLHFSIWHIAKCQLNHWSD